MPYILNKIIELTPDSETCERKTLIVLGLLYSTSGRDGFKTSGDLKARVHFANMKLELIFNAGSMRAVWTSEGFDGQVCGQVTLQVPLAGETTTARGTLE